MNFLSIDIGTSCVKYQLFSDKGEILDYKRREYDFKVIGKDYYVDIDGIWANLKDMIKGVAENFEFSSICISTIGESFALLDKDDNVLVYPMLYTDARGEKESEILYNAFTKEKLFSVTGVLPQSMYSINKLLWIKNNLPETFNKADKALLMCDYFGYLLTGERVIDYGLAARTGAFDVGKLEFSKEILDKVGVPISLFSKPARTGSVVGEIKGDIIKELGIKGSPVVVLGSHDQICAALGAGIVEAGDSVDGMGTVECLTTVFNNKPDDVRMGEQGYPVVPYAVEGLYCTYVLNFSRGSTVDWLRKSIMHKYSGEEKDFFEYMEKGLDQTPSGILWLPYFGGAATPFQNVNAKGAIVNLTTKTKDVDFYKGLLEGMAMEMRLNMDETAKYGIDYKRIVVTGGGATSPISLQIKANVENKSLYTLRSSEGGLCGVAMLSAVALGAVKDIKEAKEIFAIYDSEVLPNKDIHAEYSEQYKKYKKTYETIKELY